MGHVSNLEHCGLMVIAASPELDEKFSCRVLLGAQDLGRWLDENQRHIRWKDPETFDALVQWLHRADPSINKVARLSPEAYRLLAGNIEELVQILPRLFRCDACGETHDNIKALRQPITDTDIYSSWYVLWICQGGNVLYRHLRELHISPGD